MSAAWSPTACRAEMPGWKDTMQFDNDRLPSSGRRAIASEIIGSTSIVDDDIAGASVCRTNYSQNGRRMRSRCGLDERVLANGLGVVMPAMEKVPRKGGQNKISAKSYASRNCAYFPYFTAPRRTSDLIEICAISAEF